MIVLASVFGALSGLTGAYVSYVAPGMPTGPWIVMVISIIAIFSFFLAPKRGIVSKTIRQFRIKNRLLEENILKTFFALGERDNQYYEPRSMNELMAKRSFTKSQITKGLRRLRIGNFIQRRDNQWVLLRQGFIKGKRIQRLHRLWELYLTEYLKIAPDHVHEDAESIEHIITPELELKLEALLNFPEKDPHQTLIPKKE